MKRGWRAWQVFLWNPVSPLGLSVFRTVFALLVIWNILLILPDLTVFYSEKGVLPFEVSQRLLGAPRLNLFRWLPRTDGVIYFFAFSLVASAFSLMIGLFTRVSAFFVFLLLVSFDHRNIFILNSGDTLMRLMAFYLIFAPSGAALSVDRLWAIFQGREKVDVVKRVPAIMLRVMQFQLSVLYFSAFVWKVQGKGWVSGEAVYFTTRLEDFLRFPMPDFARSLWFSRLASWGTLVVEGAMGTLVWVPRLRPYVLLAGLSLHLGLEYSMTIPIFQLVIMSCYVLFVDGEAIEKVLSGWRLPPGRLVVFYDGDCGFCVRVVNVLRAIDFRGVLIWKNARLSSVAKSFSDLDVARAERELLVWSPQGGWNGGWYGGWYGGYDAFRVIARELLLLRCVWPFLYIPGVPWLGRRAYAWVAEHRQEVSRFLLG